MRCEPLYNILKNMSRITLIILMQCINTLIFAQNINCQKAIEYEKDENFEKAVREYTSCIKKNETDFRLYNHRGKCYSLLGNQQLAYLDFVKADSLHPDVEAVNNNIGISLELQEKYNEANLYYDKAIRINDQYTEAYFNKGRTYEKMNLPDSAEFYYLKVVEINPKDKGVQIVLAMLYESLGRFDSAIVMQTNAIKLDSNDADLYYFRAIDYDTLQKYDQAIQDYNTFLDKTKDHYDYQALCKRGKAKEFSGDMQSALTDYSKAISGSKKPVAAYVSRYQLYLKLNEADKACDDYKMILKLDKDLAAGLENSNCK